jgi:hypothetical protein
MADVADHLRDLSSRLIDCLNTRTFHVVDAMYLTLHKVEYLKANPNYRTEILDMSVHIESTSTAKVWVRRTVTGLGGSK